MKRVVCILAALIFALPFAKAQEEHGGTAEVKRIALVSPHYGEDYRPKSGDFSLGVSFVPVINFIGNMFNNTATNTLDIGELFNGNSQIYGRYFLSDNMAIRASLGITSTSNTLSVRNVPKADGADPDLFVTDKGTYHYNRWDFGGGVQWFRGKNRLVGFYGAGLGLTFERNVQTYKYANELKLDGSYYSAVFPAPDETNKIIPTPTGSPIQGNTRMLRNADGLRTTILATGFAGVEYYIFPKVALGFEANLGIGGTIVGTGSVKMEQPNSDNNAIEIDKSPGNVSEGGFNSRTTMGGDIYLMIHF